MKKDPVIYLLHIKESASLLEKYLAGKTKREFSRSLELQDAVARRLEIIGEAVKKLPVSFRKKYPLVPWQKAADMRNFLIHEYFGVNLKIVWNTAKNDLPKFIGQIEDVIRKNKQKLISL